MIVLLLLACAEEAAPLVAAPAVWIESRAVGEGEVVRLHAPAGSTLPPVDGLKAEKVEGGSPDVETWQLSGPSGSYTVEVAPPGGPPTQLFFDIGVVGPSGGPMEDLASLPAPAPARWPRVAAAVALLTALAAAGILAWRRLRPAPPPPPPEPADRVARRAWAALRARTDLPPDVLAAELSAVYRRYLEATARLPATSRTSREILDALAGDLTAVQLDRARRLLGAMDIVRFSERSTHGEFFSSLDADFEALLTRAGVGRA